MSELRAQELKKRFKSRSVVKDVSLEVQSGEVVGLLGPNGAGKTTCFYMIVGLIPPMAATSIWTKRISTVCRYIDVRGWGWPTCRKRLPSSAN